jgi:hypothetical protein
MIRFVITLLFCAYAGAQTQSFDSCSADVTKTEGDNHRIRISTGVSESLIEKAPLPSTGGLDKKLSSTVIVKTLVDRNSTVRCAEAVHGDPSLFQCSMDAALYWRFRPYAPNNQPVIVVTSIEFEFHKGKVKAR